MSGGFVQGGLDSFPVLLNSDSVLPREMVERMSGKGLDTLHQINGDIQCKVDSTWHSSLETLHKHLRKLKIKQEVYYRDHAPRHDLATGEVIPFKAPAARYLEAEFIDKNHLKLYLKTFPEAGRQWAINWLAKRKAQKALIYPPLQAELRSLFCPTILYYNHVGGYTAICRELGFQIRFEGTVPAARPLDCPVVIDTREQNALKLKVPTISGTVHCGDYALPTGQDQGVYIERKSLQDFVGTLSDRETRAGDSNLARFTRELERAQETGAYLVLLVEVDINQALSYNYLPHMKHVKVQPDHIWKNLRDLFHRFPDFQALFVGGRVEAAKAVPALLSMGAAVKTFDIQAAYESGELAFP